MLNIRVRSCLIIFVAVVSTFLSFQPVFGGPSTIAEKMAFVDGNYPNSVKVTRYNYLLTTLEKKTGDSKERIGDMTVKAQDILRNEEGQEITLLALLEGVNKTLATGSKTPFANAIALYITVIGR